MPSIDTITLADCAALIFAPDGRHYDHMAALAGTLGFGHVLEHTKLNALPEKALPFFLIHNGVIDHLKQRLLRGLRSTDEPRRKYAPIICVIPQGPRHKMVPQVEMGFDDVVFLSDPIEQVSKTLTDQLGHEVLYIDSPHYFGPDRRRLERVSRGDPRRVPGGTEHRRIQVLRDPQHGIQVSYVN
ncbi:hypothetical protein [Devosia marina]|uniref:Uncharacterized protein n=1 Tax=Devosia marina TaxID=2683198 RepID=A0A7X3FT13_9HYPH|nr:hypothetical protein [Devosia marina]MVT00200.1 hypothetical protein [Devosia marina]